MDLKLHEDYVYTRKLNLDLNEQRFSANMMYNYVKENFADKDHSGQDTMVYDLYLKYNYMMYALPGIHSLYTEIRRTFYECAKHKFNGNDPYEGKYFMQSWLNFYHKGQFIDWHGHWPPEYHSWHGFYCVDVEPESSTTYKLSNGKIVEIKSEDNLLVLGPSDGDEHRSSEWNLDRPRITIAFDIAPERIMCDTNTSLKIANHWVPL